MLGLTSWRDCCGNSIRERFPGGHVADCRVMRPATVTGGDIWNERSLDFGSGGDARRTRRRSGSADAKSGPERHLAANSFADLLQPIPNAAALLRAVDEITTEPASGRKSPACSIYHHHHHHHHRQYRRYYDDAPGSSSCPDIAATITIIITTTTITASTAATIEVARHRMMRKQDLEGPVFLCGPSPGGPFPSPRGADAGRCRRTRCRSRRSTRSLPTAFGRLL